MKFNSTKGQSPSLPVSKAMLMGAAPDGGLYVPQKFPSFTPNDFGDANDLPAIAHTLLSPFFAGDVLADALKDICAQVFDFPAPLVAMDENKLALELFHGPTAAFKDFGARFLAAAMDRLANDDHPLTVLVATSGDTGGAVGCAFAGARAAKVVILYPKGRVSPFQELQLTCWPGVRALRVDGDFDDCQRLVKAAFADPALKERYGLSSANSINIGRLLPQMVYYAASSLAIYRQNGQKANYVIPTGNLGNGMACLWARACGLPIGKVVLAQNANRAMVRFFDEGQYAPAPSIATIANAMDVGNPSNFERFDAGLAALNHDVRALSVDDATIRAQIRKDAQENNHDWCPHSAVAAYAYDQLGEDEKADPWVIVATAHPYKFREIVEPLVGHDIAPSPALAAIKDMSMRVQDIPADLNALSGVLADLDA
ncbi:MAG: threonine synthase [Robiginitomaculum sp.]|nr:threonine synthase [Robiginitomaculum sp.]MDQ7078828.1 threonine synthase [Robiginitomaculum sp.]